MLNAGLRIGEFIYPKGVAEFVKTRFFTPVTKKLTDDQQYWIDKAQQFSIPFKNEHITAWKTGKGPSILFAHGWNGRGAQFNHFFGAAVEAGYSVIFFDAPAHGDSGGDMSNYLEFTAAIDTLLNHEISEDVCAIVGHSLGTSAAINQRSEKSHSLPMVLVAPPFYLMELLFASFQMHGVPKRTYLSLIWELEQAYQIPLDTKNPVDLINEIDNKILIIHDQKDRTTPIGPSVEMADKYENIDLFSTEGFGHSLLLRQEVVVKKALDYIKENGRINKDLMELADVSA